MIKSNFKDYFFRKLLLYALCVINICHFNYVINISIKLILNQIFLEEFLLTDINQGFRKFSNIIF